jgi:hypothetical protein
LTCHYERLYSSIKLDAAPKGPGRAGTIERNTMQASTISHDTQSLIDAITILNKARNAAAMADIMSVYRVVLHACEYLEDQLAAKLRG